MVRLIALLIIYMPTILNPTVRKITSLPTRFLMYSSTQQIRRDFILKMLLPLPTRKQTLRQNRSIQSSMVLVSDYGFPYDPSCYTFRWIGGQVGYVSLAFFFTLSLFLCDGWLIVSRVHLILERGAEVELALLDLGPGNGQHRLWQTHGLQECNSQVELANKISLLLRKHCGVLGR